MASLNWSRSQIADEIEDTLKFGGLTSNWGKIRVKESDKNGKSFYSLPFNRGCVKIYGAGFIMVNRDVCRSVDEAKRVLQLEYVE